MLKLSIIDIGELKEARNSIKPYYYIVKGIVFLFLVGFGGGIVALFWEKTRLAGIVLIVLFIFSIIFLAYLDELVSKVYVRKILEVFIKNSDYTLLKKEMFVEIFKYLHREAGINGTIKTPIILRKDDNSWISVGTISISYSVDEDTTQTDIYHYLFFVYENPQAALARTYFLYSPQKLETADVLKIAASRRSRLQFSDMTNKISDFYTHNKLQVGVSNKEFLQKIEQANVYKFFKDFPHDCFVVFLERYIFCGIDIDKKLFDIRFEKSIDENLIKQIVSEFNIIEDFKNNVYKYFIEPFK